MEENESKKCKKNPDKFVQWICLSSIPSKSAHSVRLASSAACALLKESGAVNFILNPVISPDQAAIGACLSLYNYTALKSEKPKQLFVGCTCSNEIFNFGMRCAYYQNITRFLSDTPANLLTPRLFCEYAHKIGTEAGLNVTSHDEEYIREKDMNPFLSVSAGSNEPPMYLTAEYNGRSENENHLKKIQNTSRENKSLDEQKASHDETGILARDENFTYDICLIGKGVTFDSGGISLKPSLNMAEMKGDMQGAAASFCAARLVADQKLNLNLMVEIPLTENMPGSKATKPGDVKKQ